MITLKGGSAVLTPFKVAHDIRIGNGAEENITINMQSGAYYEFPAINFTRSNILTCVGTWYMKCLASSTVFNTAVDHCNAAAGVQIDATDESNTDNLNNVNWDFGS